MGRTLVVVHPGYALNDCGYDTKMEETYGDYKEYSSRLDAAMRESEDCVILLDIFTSAGYKRDVHALPFSVPWNAEVIVDEPSLEGKMLVERLKYRGATNIGLCGEFLWWYGSNVKPEQVREVARSMPERERAIVERVLDDDEDLDFVKLREHGVDTKHIIELFNGVSVQSGCVVHTKNFLEESGAFSVSILRELCYPVREPETKRDGYAQ